jgi:hypothetical protein
MVFAPICFQVSDGAIDAVGITSKPHRDVKLKISAPSALLIRRNGAGILGLLRLQTAVFIFQLSERHWPCKNGDLRFSAIYRFDLPQARQLPTSQP